MKKILFPFDLLMILICLNKDAKKIYTDKGQIFVATFWISLVQFLLIATLMNVIIFLTIQKITFFYTLIKILFFTVLPLICLMNYLVYVKEERLIDLRKKKWVITLENSDNRNFFWILGIVSTGLISYLFFLTQEMIMK